MRAHYVLLMTAAALLACSDGASDLAPIDRKNLVAMAPGDLVESVNTHADGKRSLRIHTVEERVDDGDEDEDDDNDDNEDLDATKEERAQLFSSEKIAKLLKPDETHLFQKIRSWNNKGYSPSTIWDRLNLGKSQLRREKYRKIYDTYAKYYG